MVLHKDGDHHGGLPVCLENGLADKGGAKKGPKRYPKGAACNARQVEEGVGDLHENVCTQYMLNTVDEKNGNVSRRRRRRRGRSEKEEEEEEEEEEDRKRIKKNRKKKTHTIPRHKEQW